MSKVPITRRKIPLTTEMQIAADLLSEPKNAGLTLQEIADRSGISVRQLYTWRTQNEDFIEEVKRLSTIKAGQHVAEVYDILLREIRKKPNAKMIETFLKTQGLLQPDVQMNQLQINQNDRSQEAIEAEIERITRELEENEASWEKRKRELQAKHIIDVDLEEDEDDE